MCGIVGLIDTRANRPLDLALLKAMNQSQTHRGPDGEGTFSSDGVGLGHRRLAIIDVSGGHQPLFNEDRSVVVTYNGEIYNFQELMQELEGHGHTFRTKSDTEVIVHAWEEWGPRCVERFRGMFAFGLWDARQSKLFLARDRVGIKPLYYAELDDGWLAFGSELKSLQRHPQFPSAIDGEAVEDYLALGYVPEPRTIFKRVKKLPPGHTLTVRRGKGQLACEEYWDLDFQARTSGNIDMQEDLRQRLAESVRLRMISEVPLGAFLSGGVDSSAIVAMMASASADPVNTCSISFGDRQFDESNYAAQVAEQYQTVHRSEQVDPEDFSLIDKLVDVYDEPFADSSAIPTYRVCELARKNVTVCLSGDGGDEGFAGYRRYQWHMNEERIRRFIPLSVRQKVFSPLGNLYPKLDWAPRVFRAKTTLQALGRDSVAAYFQTVSVINDQLRHALYSNDFKRQLNGYSALEVFRRHAANCPVDDPLSLVQYIDLKTYLVGDILTKVDRASMAHSLEVRVPLLDHEFLEWVCGLAPDQKLKGQTGKHLLKKSLEPLLPKNILYRSKMGFAVPLARWFRDPLRKVVRERLTSGAIVESGLFDPAALANIVAQHQSGNRDHSAVLWSLLTLDRFLQRQRTARSA